VHVRDALTQRVTELPATLRRTPTWDQGEEAAQHARLTLAAIEVARGFREAVGWRPEGAERSM